VQDDERLAAGLVLLGIRFDTGRVQDERVRLEVQKLLLARLDEERLREERMPRRVGDHAHEQAVRGVGARERVHDVEVMPVQVVHDLFAEAFEVLLVHRLVDVAPRDAVFGLRLAHEELVLGRAAGVASGVDDERAALREPPLLVDERVCVEERGRRIPVDAAFGIEPVVFESAGGRSDGHGARLIVRVLPRNAHWHSRRRPRKFYASR
jgi:hypothetical protein